MRYKYPRTTHLPWSRSKTEDDKVLKNTDHFRGNEVVVTEKLDGENTTLYTDYMHARSIDSKDHDSRHWLKQMHASIGFQIPEGWRICGENVFAMHSIHYTRLTDYFYAFSIFSDQNVCLSWSETMLWCQKLNIQHAPILYEGVFDEKIIQSLYTQISKFGGEQEGYVVRLKDAFHYDDFKLSIAKFVRKNHVQTDDHWLSKQITMNLRKDHY
ncbi:RNA ligase family protein [Chengkuizengella sediminis]|uniref:RNA ligase family protein n=1 Tax=Chengkuizengella sediminis TaxID=1885917 RepID=UPI001389FDE0|nr:RNA ligase family protein [Chengkuizengella sediminis]NDI37262.1 RNA ligase family protein [Chengkuizengella sediminis]